MNLMNIVTGAIASLVLATLPASALEKEFVDHLVESARTIEQDASKVSLALKSKKSSQSDVMKMIDAMNSDLDKLRQLADQYETTHPKMSGRDLEEWKLIRQKIQLLEIFHQRKQTLASQDINKNRSLIRAHADGVALRASKLQESALKLRRVPIS